MSFSSANQHKIRSPVSRFLYGILSIEVLRFGDADLSLSHLVRSFHNMNLNRSIMMRSRSSNCNLTDACPCLWHPQLPPYSEPPVRSLLCFKHFSIGEGFILYFVSQAPVLFSVCAGRPLIFFCLVRLFVAAIPAFYAQPLPTEVVEGACVQKKLDSNWC